MKKVALYSPYIPKHSGGGERYLLSIAQVASWSCETSLLVSADLKAALEAKIPIYEATFGLDLSRVKLEVSSFGRSGNPLRTLKATKEFDVLFAMTDGSIPPTMAKKSYLITQVPWLRHLKLTEQLKLRSWTSILVYSNFVATILRKSWSSNKVKILTPYVDTRDFQLTPIQDKEKLIINVGRFFSHAQSNSKRQDVLISAFAKLLTDHQMKGWHLALIGSVDPNPDSQQFLSTLKEMARGYPISIHTDLSYDELRSYYSRASIYWHAAGFEVDEQKSPENTEHFGITTLEAMASGCIPFVVPKGGQPEIVADDRLYWSTVDELVQKSEALCTSMQKDPNAWRSLTTEMARKCEPYSKGVFEREVAKYL